jgi:hypothetical protein
MISKKKKRLNCDEQAKLTFFPIGGLRQLDDEPSRRGGFIS